MTLRQDFQADQNSLLDMLPMIVDELKTRRPEDLPQALIVLSCVSF